VRVLRRYKVYLDYTVPADGLVWNDDTNANWVQVFPKVSPLKKAPFEKERFTRYDWGEIEFKNEPKYTGDASEVYDLISNCAVDQEIRIKVIFPSDLINPDTTTTVRGYFGHNDCKFDDDKKILTVKPSILDQYTDVIENWETKVDIIPEQTTKRASWKLPSDYSSLYPSGINESHSMPLGRVSTDMTEAKDVPGAYVVSDPLDPIADVPKIIDYCVTNYTTSMSLSVLADATLSVDETVKFYLDIYDNTNTLIQSNLLDEVTYGEATGTSISTSYSLSPSLQQGYSIYIYTILSDETGTDTIDYIDLNFSVTFVNILATTHTVDVKMQDSDLKTITIWSDWLHGATEKFKKSDFESDFTDLTDYFNSNGSPKDDPAKGVNPNQYAPYSVNVSEINNRKIEELGSEVITINDQYIADIESSLDEYGFELSDITLYLCKSNRIWPFAQKYRTRATIKFSRFEQKVTDGESPVGSGWDDSGYVDNNNKRLFTKKPFDGTDYGWTRGSIDTTPGTVGGRDYIQKINSTKLSNYPDGDTSLQVQGMDFKVVTQSVYNGTFETLTNRSINSAFFWNDSDSVVTVDSGINYITNEENHLNNISAVHTYQFKNEDDDSEDSILRISFKDLISDIKKLFNFQVFWWIDTSDVLHIEHIKYIDLPDARQIMDLTISATDNTPYLKNQRLLSEISNYNYEKSEMYSLVEFKIVNSGYTDFTENKIVFDKIVSNKRNKDIKDTITTQVLSTDLKYAVHSPGDLENGIVLINHDGNYNSVSANSPISNRDIENGNLALSNILLTYKYEGTYLDGKINGSNVSFDITTRTKKGREFTIKGIYDYDYFKNILGVGFIQSLTHDLENESTKITLSYRFGSGVESDQFLLMISEVGDYDGAENIMYNLG
jgi:hypothetical protein